MFNTGDRVIIGKNDYDTVQDEHVLEGRGGTVGAPSSGVIVLVHVDGFEDPVILGDAGWAFKIEEVSRG